MTVELYSVIGVAIWIAYFVAGALLQPSKPENLSTNMSIGAAIGIFWLPLFIAAVVGIVWICVSTPIVSVIKRILYGKNAG